MMLASHTGIQPSVISHLLSYKKVPLNNFLPTKELLDDFYHFLRFWGRGYLYCLCSRTISSSIYRGASIKPEAMVILQLDFVSFHLLISQTCDPKKTLHFNSLFLICLVQRLNGNGIIFI